MRLTINVAPFKLTNYIRPLTKGTKEGTMIDVGELDDEQAIDYWNDMKKTWMQHVSQRRSQLRQSAEGEGRILSTV